MRQAMKEMKWEQALMGVLYVLLGLVCLVAPDAMEKTLALLVAAVLILAGIASMVMYIKREAHLNLEQNDFFFGLVGVTLGIVVLRKTELMSSMITALLGIMVLFSGFSKLQSAVDMKRLKFGNWGVMVAVAVINVAVGIFLVLFPLKAARALLVALGVSLILFGIADIVVTFFFARKVSAYKGKKKQKEEDVLERATASNLVLEDAEKTLQK